MAGDISTINAADGGGDTAVENSGKKKRRHMSKAERKRLKKKQKLTSSSTSDGDKVPNNDTDTKKTTPQNKKLEPTLEEYMVDYIPAPPPVSNDDDNKDTTSLGKWFPKASLTKSRVCYSNDYLAKLAKNKKKNPSSTEEEPKASLVLFYQYVSPQWSEARVSSFLSYLTAIAKKHRTNIGGRVRVSTEGVNATVSAASTSNSTHSSEFEAAQTLRHFCNDLKQFDKEFEKTDFKFIDGLSADRHFKELKLIPVKELVFYGIREDDCATATISASTKDTGSDGSKNNNNQGKEVKGGVHLDAKDYHEMLKQKDAVVIDVRNHYEAAIGRFDGQMENAVSAKKDEDTGTAEGCNKEGNVAGATYIDPKMRKSTDFTSWLAEPETKQKLEGKTVMMFCTGGIRCERASAYLNTKMGDDVKGVYQLQGGIERYLQEFPSGGFWRGKNFVFDKREAISAGNINGDGGVVRKDNATDEKKSVCAKCSKPWDRYIGKRKCFTCGVPVLVCDACMSGASTSNKKKKKKRKKSKNSDDDKTEASQTSTAPKEENDRVRCPLCVEEGVTVPAADVEYTDNGVSVGRKRASSFSESSPAPIDGTEGKKKKDDNKNNKAAKSVLKWGGGHATKKKEKKKWSKRLCQFGSECVRKDCYFYHPEREAK